MRMVKQALNFTIVCLAIGFLIDCQIAVAEPISSDKANQIGIVLMHGKGGTTKRIDDLSDGLKGLGALVETPLMPWSEDRIYDKGYEESMAEIDTYVSKLKADGAKRTFVARHSIGANAALGYGARRGGLSGVILLAYGHVPGVRGFARKLEDSTDKAQAMINAGKGEEKAEFDDVGGKNDTARATANDLFSWFDPDGSATMAANAPKVKPNTPVLCVDGSNDDWQRCDTIMRQLPEHSKNSSVFVDAKHLQTPSKSLEQIEK